MIKMWLVKDRNIVSSSPLLKYFRLIIIVIVVCFVIQSLTGCEQAKPNNNNNALDYETMSQEERIEAVWGDLIEANGGELKYETLTKEEQALVKYPPLDEDKVYWTPKGHNYHSVEWCYTLEESKNIKCGTLKNAIKNGKESPCSKCVGDSFE